MILTSDNYFSREANMEYMSASQWKDFHGAPGLPSCEARAKANAEGNLENETSQALLIGSYVDSYFEGTLDQFISEHPEIFLKNTLDLPRKQPELKQVYKHADKMIERCERDEVFMRYMSGEKQVIMTAVMFDVLWKIKIDSYIPGRAIVDLKTTQSIRKIYNVKDEGSMCFIDYFGYVYQMAIYQKVVETVTGNKLDCYIAAVSKEKEPDIGVFYIPQYDLDAAIHEVERTARMYNEIKQSGIEPIKCGFCDYCKSIKVLDGPVSYKDILGDPT